MWFLWFLKHPGFSASGGALVGRLAAAASVQHLWCMKHLGTSCGASVTCSCVDRVASACLRPCGAAQQFALMAFSFTMYVELSRY